MIQRRFLLPGACLVAVLSFARPAAAIPIAADWLTTSSGTLNGVAFTTTGFGGPFLNIENRNYVGPDFAGAAVGAAEGLEYSATDDWSVTFASPIANLRLIVDLWRGDYVGGTVDPTSTYAFNHAFSIVSGMTGATVAANTLSLADPELAGFSFYDGVLLFAGPITTLSVDATAFDGSGQVLTFAVDVPQVVPEPASFDAGRSRRHCCRRPLRSPTTDGS